METDARAFWLREPGVGEIRPVALPEPGPGEVLVRTLYSGISRGTETLVFRGGVPASQYADDAGAVPGRRVSRAGEVRLPQRRRGRRRARRSCSAARCSACTRTRPRTWCRRARWSSCPTRCRRRGPCWPAPWRPRSTRCGTPRRCSATGSPWSAPAWSAAASRACWPGFPASEVKLVDVDRRRADVADALGVELRAARRTPRRPRPGRSTPARPPPACSGRWSCSARRARSSS